MINKKSKIFVTGHKGLVGSAILRRLNYYSFKNIITIDKKKLDLRDQQNVSIFFKKNKIDAVINAAAKVGGIYANDNFKADFIYDNLSIQNNIIHGSFKAGVKNLVFLGSSCIYPKFSKQPIKEEYLLTGELEPTNEFYAIAKIAGIKLCESYNHQYRTNYKCLMPSNLFGPNDNYNSNNSHFFPAFIKKIYLGKMQKKEEILFWGTGRPKRELTFVDDVAEACVFFLNKKTSDALINIGSGFELSIKQYADYVARIIGYKSKIIFDGNKMMDGTERKLVNCALAKRYGWKSKFSFSKGFKITYQDFLVNKKRYLGM